MGDHDTTAGGPDDLHEWISVEDPGERRTWVFDARFLRSNHRCIYGEGCQGIGDVPDAAAGLGCCSVGAQLVDDDDVQTVVRSFVRLDAGQMQHHEHARRHGFLRTDDQGATATRLVDGACIFLNRPGFVGGGGCALHLGALTDGDRPLDRKPNVCWQLPLRVERYTDDSGWTTVTLRRWRRDDWDGAVAWWCTEEIEAFVADEPVLSASRDEIVELVGEAVYDRIVDTLGRTDS